MNRINVSLQQSIITLVERGWSKRRIARELQLDRATVTRQLLAKANAATNPALGSGEAGLAKPAANPAQGAEDQAPNAATNPAVGSPEVAAANAASNPTLGARPGPPSLCAPFTAKIEAAVEAGLSAQRIYQDLISEHGRALNGSGRFLLVIGLKMQGGPNLFIHHGNRYLNWAWRRRSVVISPLKLAVKLAKYGLSLVRPFFQLARGFQINR